MRSTCRLSAWLAAVALCLTACGPTDSGQLKISARSAAAFAAWQSYAGKHMTDAEQREWSDLLQELRYDIMARHEATGSAAIDERLRERIHDRTVHDVRRTSLTLRCNRLEREASQLRRNVKYRLKTAPGDTASSRYLDQQNEILRERLTKVEAELAAAENRLSGVLGIAPP